MINRTISLGLIGMVLAIGSAEAAPASCPETRAVLVAINHKWAGYEDYLITNPSIIGREFRVLKRTAGPVKRTEHLLLQFAAQTGYLPLNVGAAVKAPSVKNTLAERILDEADVMRVLALESAPRNRALLTLLYGAGLRISEICGLRWRDLIARDTAGQVTVYGKGGKTRVVLLSARTWALLDGTFAAGGH